MLTEKGKLTLARIILILFMGAFGCIIIKLSQEWWHGVLVIIGSMIVASLVIWAIKELLGGK